MCANCIRVSMYEIVIYYYNTNCICMSIWEIVIYYNNAQCICKSVWEIYYNFIKACVCLEIIYVKSR